MQRVALRLLNEGPDVQVYRLATQICIPPQEGKDVSVKKSPTSTLHEKTMMVHHEDAQGSFTYLKHRFQQFGVAWYNWIADVEFQRKLKPL